MHRISRVASLRSASLRLSSLKVGNANTDCLTSISSDSRRMNSTTSVDAASSAVKPLFESVTSQALTNSPPDLILGLIENIHLGMQVPYWESIVLLTIGMRVCLLPMGIKMAQSSARMAAVRPLLTKVTDAMKRDPQSNNSARKKQYSEQSKALLKQYKVNPFLSLLMPLIQLPIFISFFFGLRKIGEYFPGVEDGGLLWFTDLAAADSTMILPILNSLTFLAMIELGADGMAGNDQAKFKWVMRGLAVVMTPATMAMPTGVFVYWTTNNALSVAQASVLKLDNVKDYLGIPPPPPKDPTSTSGSLISDDNPIVKAFNDIKKDITTDKATAEIVDGTVGSSYSMPLVKPTGPPPTTFSKPRSKNNSKKK